MNELRIKIMVILIMGAMIILGIKLYEFRQRIEQLDIASQNLLLETEKLDKQLKLMIKEHKEKHQKDIKDTDNE